MDENILKFRVGIFVVIALCILGILIFLNSEGWVAQYTIFIKPTSAPGVTTGTPIRKNGILIGRAILPLVNEGDAVFHRAQLSPKAADDTVEGLVTQLESDPLFDEDEII